MTNSIDGGSEEFQALIEAKQSGDYSHKILAPKGYSATTRQAEQIDETSEYTAATVDNSNSLGNDVASEIPAEITFMNLY